MHLSKPLLTTRMAIVAMSRVIDLVWKPWLGSKHVQETIPAQVRNDKESTIPFVKLHSGTTALTVHLQRILHPHRSPPFKISRLLKFFNGHPRKLFMTTVALYGAFGSTSAGLEVCSGEDAVPPRPELAIRGLWQNGVP